MAGYRGKNLTYLNIGTDALENTKGDLSISVAQDEIDTRDDDSDGYNDAIPGDQTITISGSFNFMTDADTAPGQDALIAASINQTVQEFTWAYESATGVDEYTADGFVTSLDSVNGDPQTMSFSIRIAEKPAVAAQV